MKREEYFEKDKKKNILWKNLAVSYRNSVKGVTAKPLDRETDFDALLSLAEKHAVVCGVYDAVKCSDCSKEVLRKYTEKLGLAVRKEIFFDLEYSKISSCFVAAEIPFVPIKGIIIKGLYSKIGMRQFCDFDILVKKDKINEAKRIMVSLGYCVSNEDGSENNTHEAIAVIECIKKPFYNIELHKKLFFGTKKNYFDNIWDNIVFPAETPFVGKMRDEDIYLYHLAHLYSHMKERSGVGIRYLSDHYVIKNKLCSNELFNREYVENVLKSEGMTEFEKEIDFVTENLFEADEADMDLDLLHDFLNNGVHGTIENKVRMSVKENGKTRFLIKRIFPPKKDMEISYTVLKKRPFLLPFYWAHRLFSVVFSKKRRSIAKKEFSSFKKI